MKRIKEGLLVAAGALIMSPVMADYGDADAFDSSYRSGHYDYAEVIDAEPIYRTVEISTPRQVCWDEVRYEDEGYIGRRRGSVAGSAIIGGVIGGVIGHQIGSGRGNEIATVAGAIAGSAIGASRTAKRNRQRQYEPVVVERCETRNEYEEREVLDGYNVVYEYNGRQYTTRTDAFPGDSIRVRVSVVAVDEY